MSTVVYSLTSEPGKTRSIACRLSASKGGGLIVRFAFPEVLLPHISHVELTGDDGYIITIGALFSQAATVDFLSNIVSQEYLTWGAQGKKPYVGYELKKDTWEMT